MDKIGDLRVPALLLTNSELDAARAVDGSRSVLDGSGRSAGALVKNLFIVRVRVPRRSDGLGVLMESHASKMFEGGEHRAEMMSEREIQE